MKLPSIFAFVLFLLVGLSSAAPLDHQWSSSFGASDTQMAAGVAINGSGRIALTGSFRNTIDLGGGPLSNADFYEDIFVAQFDDAGTHLWSHSFGDVNGAFSFQRGRDADNDVAGNVAVTGDAEGTVDFGGGPLSTGRVFLAEFDAAGNHLWSRVFGEPPFFNDTSTEVEIDGSGSVVMAGAFTDSIDFGGGALFSSGLLDAFVAKFSSTGNLLWSHRFGVSYYDEVVEDMTVDGSGNVMITVHATGSTPYQRPDVHHPIRQCRQ